ncbi:MAG: DNA-binding protein WhiA [Firmicutes bacterium]|nr:DNA-binding protein WhiA [Bacillota bacterium]
MIKEPSFTSIVKEEITTKPFNDERLRAMLSAYVKTNGRMVIQNKTTEIVLATENAKIAKFLFLIIQKLYGISPRFAYTRMMKFEKKVTYNVIIEEKSDAILEDLGVSFLSGKISRLLVSNDDTLGGYVAGAFLATGSVNNPASSNYHLEISTTDEDYAKYLVKLVGRYKNVDLTPKIIKRRNQFVVYLKKSDQIADFLILMGATDATLEYENVRVNRDFSNNDNRWQICANANMNKVVEASGKQIEEIQIIDRVVGIEHLPNEKMKLLCRLRLDNDGASMLELAEKMSDEMHNPVSKSNINHLFRAIHEMAERYKEVGE